jgi:hypothetical protein
LVGTSRKRRTTITITELRCNLPGCKVYGIVNDFPEGEQRQGAVLEIGLRERERERITYIFIKGGGGEERLW